jgi:cytochrome c biogenesis protein CcmG, thiol:disulfide interchange protein DsbE
MVEGEDKQSTPVDERKTSMGRTITVAAGVIFLLLLGYILIVLIGPSSGASGSTAAVDSPAPDFKLSLLGGGELSLASLRGSPVVVNFWGSWCDPCRAEAPALESVWRKNKDKGVAFVGLAVEDTEPDAKAYIKEFNITYPNGLVDPSVTKAYRITGVPETFLISRDGRLARKFIGPIDEAHLQAAVDELVKQ